MDLETSVKMINEYAQAHNITACDAIIELDHLIIEDWTNTLPGAPKGYRRKTSLAMDDAIVAFCHNRRKWVDEAIRQGVDVSDFVLP